MHFLYVKVPVAHRATSAPHQLEDRIDELIREAGVGAVAGWGDSLGAALADGSGPVAYTRIDIDVSDQAAARALLRANLPPFGAPKGTEIHYTIERRHHMDLYEDPDWLLMLPL